MNAAVIVETRARSVHKVAAEHFRYLDFNKWEVIMIGASDATVNSIKDYNKLLTSVKFWEKLTGYERVLIFQTDSNTLRTGIEEFLQWDYVGAPWPWQDHGGNGGLSLRNPRVMLNVINNVPYNGDNEDTYFSNALHARPDLGKLAPRHVCEKFSCETIFKLGTFGYHAIEKYLPDDAVRQIKTQYCK